jgi:hypothetical protein
MKGQLANLEMERVAGLLVSDIADKGMLLEYSPENLAKIVDERFEFWVCCHAIVYKQLKKGNKSLAFIFADASARLQDWRIQTGGEA